jgi:two-component sensor histidine kinase
MQLVMSLTDQIDGLIELNNANGANYDIRFKSIAQPSRI